MEKMEAIFSNFGCLKQLTASVAERVVKSQLTHSLKFSDYSLWHNATFPIPISIIYYTSKKFQFPFKMMTPVEIMKFNRHHTKKFDCFPVNVTTFFA